MFKLVKVSLRRQNAQKKTNEVYLVEADICSEAENKVHRYLEEYSCKEVHVVGQADHKIYTILNENADFDGAIWAKGTVVGIEKKDVKIPKKRGGGFKTVEKKSNHYIYVKASDLKDAQEILEKYVDKDMVYCDSYNIVGVVETKIVDVIRVMKEKRQLELFNQEETK